MSGTVIKIKYSDVTNQPAPDTLAHAELAYSFTSNTLFIGEDNGTTVDAVVIGGQKFSDKLDHTHGVLTADSAIIVDANKHIDELISGGLTLTSSGGSGQKVTSIVTTMPVTPNDTQLITAAAAKTYIDTELSGTTVGDLSGVTISSVAGGHVLIYNNGTGDWENKALSGDVTIGVDGTTDISNSGVTAGSYGSGTAIPTFTVAADGRITAASAVSVATTLSIAGDSGTDSVSLLTDTLTFAGSSDLTADVTDNTVTITLDDTTVTAGSYGSASAIPTFTVDAKGRLTAASTVSVATNLTIAADSGPADTVSLLSDTLTFQGGEGIDTTVSDNKITIAGEDASTTNKGIASFDSGDFAVSGGVVTIKSAGVGNTQLENSSLTVGSTTISLGGTSTSLAGLTEVTVDNLNINGNEISSTDANGDISLNPNGTGTVDVNGARITTVGTPTSSTDAATKAYVDEVAQGIAAKPAVEAATTGDLSATYDNGTAGVGATLNLGPAATLDIDGVTAWTQYDGILVKDQTNAWENGRYYVNQVGDAVTDWILIRCGLCDEASEIPSSYVFVQHGDTYANTGWVATVDNIDDFTVGDTTDGDIDWIQFSGAGTYTGGAGLSLTGTTFDVNVAATGGIEISADALQLKSSLAGAGLTYTAGVLDVVGTTNRITVNADSIDIASTYVGQSSITTLGTIGTGTWQADVIDEVYGGTGLSSYSTGDILYASGANTLAVLAASTEGKVLQVNASGVPVWGDIDGGTF